MFNDTIGLFKKLSRIFNNLSAEVEKIWNERKPAVDAAYAAAHAADTAAALRC